jgi:hypothetical protein
MLAFDTREEVGYHLLIKKMPNTSRTPMRMPQEPDQHAPEEHGVDRQSATSVDQALA